ncbi:MAG: hypothetical protein AB7S38_13065 [Vulcanimicrobiota bacterium]
MQISAVTQRPALSVRPANRPAQGPAVATDQVSLSEAPTRVYSEPFGKIRHLALQLDHDVPTNIRNEVFNAWFQVFETMDDKTRFTIVLESDEDRQALAQRLEERNIPNRERFGLMVNDGLDITMWARDQMVGLRNANGTSRLLGQTTMRPHGDDELLPPRIAEFAGVELDADKRLVTDGGDEVSNSNESFLGFTSLYLTAKKLYDEEHPGQSTTPFSVRMVEDNTKVGYHFEPNLYKSTRGPGEEHWLGLAQGIFEEKYGRPVTVVGADDPKTPELEVPATFHIDMGLTPVDDHTILVGDPSWALSTVASLSPEQYADHNRRLNENLGTEGQDHLAALVHQNTEGDPLLQHQFDHNAQLMRERGYNVVRLPYLQGPPELSWVTYNNCLMENYIDDGGNQVKRVFLPTYDLPALDRRASQVYESLGFEVVPLKLPALTSWRGAIRCISNVLERGPAQTA